VRARLVAMLADLSGGLVICPSFQPSFAEVTGLMFEFQWLLDGKGIWITRAIVYFRASARPPTDVTAEPPSRTGSAKGPAASPSHSTTVYTYTKSIGIFCMQPMP